MPLPHISPGFPVTFRIIAESRLASPRVPGSGILARNCVTDAFVGLVFSSAILGPGGTFRFPAFAAKHSDDQQREDDEGRADDDLHRAGVVVVSARAAAADDFAHAVMAAKSAGESLASGCSVT